ncbi:MAG: hypothetical protein P1P82_05525 [Bacteroidales bacterium]|nr:hypothetical protein [Bacteroidales bacterium]MDT8431406.1 hypothetical protein [Bacteroidales bacterium]
MRITRNLVAVILAFLAVNTANAQEPAAIVFYGTLASSDTYIANQECNIEFSMISEVHEPLLVRRVDLSTDSSGHFAFYIRDIPAVFTSGARIPSVKMAISIQTADSSSMLGSEGIHVTYTLRKTGLTGYTITRMDNQEMEHSYGQQVWSFWDVDPYTYLTGSFYISFYKNRTDVNRIYQLGWEQQQRSVPEMDTISPTQRGIKGGYAVGGYKKQR